MKRTEFLKIISAAVMAAMLCGCASAETDSSRADSSDVQIRCENSSETSVQSPTESTSAEISAESSSETSAKNTAESTSDEISAESSSTSDLVSSSEESDTISAPSEPTKPTAPTDDTPFGRHGVLSVKGTNLVDSRGEKIQLRGMSTHGLAWFPDYVNRDTFKFLRDEWHTNCVRLALYTHEYGGYCSGGDRERLKSLIKNGVRYAAELGMYVIVDWHVLNDRSPLTYKDEAARFFNEMSKEFAENGNVIYEICNEPNSGPTWQDVKSYANEIIPIIRANDPDSVILVGSPTWSQDIDQAAASPLEFDNVMYTLHFYAATHTDWLRARLESCVNSGLPVFISEFGLCDASGNGAVDYQQSKAWRDVIERYNISYICWSLSNKNETSSVIKSGCDKLYGWEDSDLGEQGRLIRGWFAGG